MRVCVKLCRQDWGDVDGDVYSRLFLQELEHHRVVACAVKPSPRKQCCSRREILILWLVEVPQEAYREQLRHGQERPYLPSVRASCGIAAGHKSWLVRRWADIRRAVHRVRHWGVQAYACELVFWDPIIRLIVEAAPLRQGTAGSSSP